MPALQQKEPGKGATRPEPAKGAPETPKASEDVPHARLKRWIVWGSIVALASGASYAAGRLQEHRHVEVAEEKAVIAQQALDEKADQVNERGTLILRLEARRRLHLALVALDDRNFGIAEQHLSVASDLLSDGDKPHAELDALTRDLAAFQLVAQQDVGAQRDKVMSFVRRFDQLVPPAKP